MYVFVEKVECLMQNLPVNTMMMMMMMMMIRIPMMEYIRILKVFMDNQLIRNRDLISSRT
jgi:hypothetical protein